MKKLNSKKVFGTLLLASTLMAPQVLLAQMCSTCTQPVYDSQVEAAVNTVNQSVQEVKAGVAEVKASVDHGNTFLNNIWDYMNSDIKRRELMHALINYEAAARMDEYQYNQALYMMQAPGSLYAIVTAKELGRSESALAIDISNFTLMSTIGLLTAAKETTGALSFNIQGMKLQQQMAELYNKMQAFFMTGDTKNLNVINPALYLHALTIKESGKSLDESVADARQMVTLVTNPFPAVNKLLQAKLLEAQNAPDPITALKALTGEDQDLMIQALVENAVTTMSTSALADIVSRRIPIDKDGKPNSDANAISKLQAMDTYANARFRGNGGNEWNGQWLTNIGVASQESLLREIAQMMAFNSWMQYQQFRIQEEQLGLLATMNAVMAKVNSQINSLTRQLEAAQVAAKAEAARLEGEMKAKAEEAQKEADEAAAAAAEEAE